MLLRIHEPRHRNQAGQGIGISGDGGGEKAERRMREQEGKWVRKEDELGMEVSGAFFFL